MALALAIEEYRSKVRVFEWDASLLVEEPDDQEWSVHGVSDSRAGIVIVIRCTTAIGSSVITVPYSVQRIADALSPTAWFLEIMKRMPLLGSCNNLDWLASQLYLDWLCKFPNKFSWKPNRTLVSFIDLKINRVKPKVRDNLKKKVSRALFSSICVCKKGARVKPESKEVVDVEEMKVEEIEEYLNACPDLVIVGRGSSGMKEAKALLWRWVCLGVEKMKPSVRFVWRGCPRVHRVATTKCSHRFHRDCICSWMLDREFDWEQKSCPMCRSTLIVCL